MDTSHRTTVLAVLLGMASGGCSGELEPIEDVGTVQQAIYNGTKVKSTAGGLHHQSTVRLMVTNYVINEPTTIQCTGALLRNNVVLTARHCLRAGDSTVNSAVPSDIYVYNRNDSSNPPTCYAANCRRGSLIVQHPTVDVGLLFLENPLFIDDNTMGHAVPVLRHAADPYLHENVQCEGYGDNAVNSQGEPTGWGPLRSGWVEVDQVGQQLQTVPGETGQMTFEGDSGGPCWARSRDDTPPTPTYPYSVLSVNSSYLPYTSGAPGVGWAVAAPTFREWVRLVVNAYRPAWDLDYYPPYGSNQWPYDGWTSLNPGISPNWNHCPPEWRLNNGSISELSNCYGAYPDGTILFQRSAVIDNAWMSTRVWSEDDDAAGLVFRYADNEHFYLFIVEQSRSRARLYKRTPAGFTRLDSSSISINWGNTPMIGVLVQEDGFQGYVEGNGYVVAATDSEYPVGKVGLFTRALPAYFFDGLNVTFYGPGALNPWPWPE